MANYKGMSIPNYKIPSDSKKTTFLRNITLHYGSDGFSVIVNLDRLILSGRYGYYIVNNNDFLYDLREITGVSTKLTKEIIRFASDNNYYNKELFTRYNIITSKSLIKIFIKECKNRKGFKDEIKKICKMCNIEESQLLPKKREKYNTNNLKPFKKEQQAKESTNNSNQPIKAVKPQLCRFMRYLCDEQYIPTNDLNLIKRLNDICINYVNLPNFECKSLLLGQRLKTNKSQIIDYEKFFKENLEELFN